MPAAYAERARFDLSSPRAICLQFATCDRVLQRGDKSNRSHSCMIYGKYASSDANRGQLAFVARALARRFAIAFGDLPSELRSSAHAPHLDNQTWQMNSQQARVENAPESAARREGAKRGEAGRKDPHKSRWPHFCVRRSRLRETPPSGRLT